MDLFTKYRGSATITRRINTIRQPEGGFLSPNAFTVTAFDGGNGDGGGDLNPPSIKRDLQRIPSFCILGVDIRATVG